MSVNRGSRPHFPLSLPSASASRSFSPSSQTWHVKIRTPLSLSLRCLESFSAFSLSAALPLDFTPLTPIPSQLLLNGPGTCIPVAAAAFFLQLFGLARVRLVFAESFCRVSDLSLSGKLLYPFASLFIVMWPELLRRYPRARHLGQIV